MKSSLYAKQTLFVTDYEPYFNLLQEILPAYIKNRIYTIFSLDSVNANRTLPAVNAEIFVYNVLDDNNRYYFIIHDIDEPVNYHGKEVSFIHNLYRSDQFDDLNIAVSNSVKKLQNYVDSEEHKHVGLILFQGRDDDTNHPILSIKLDRRFGQ